MTNSTAPAGPDAPSGDFAAELRARIKAAGLSLAQLAERAELDASLVSRLANGHRAPRPEHVIAIARALGAGPLELGTEAAKAMTIEWVARAELERESASRQVAQAEAAATRREIEPLRASAEALRTQLAELEHALSRAEAARAREAGARRRAEAELAAQKARAAAAEEARAALARHTQELERALAEAERAGLALFEQARRAQDDAFGAKLLGVLGAVGTGALGFAAGYGAAPASAPRRKKTLKKKKKNGGGR